MQDVDFILTLSNVTFEWDPNKADANLAKHGLRFEEAVLVFADPRCVTLTDARHADEVRWNTTGSIAGILVATVTHTERRGAVRIISARPASRKERLRYHADDQDHPRPSLPQP